MLSSLAGPIGLLSASHTMAEFSPDETCAQLDSMQERQDKELQKTAEDEADEDQSVPTTPGSVIASEAFSPSTCADSHAQTQPEKVMAQLEDELKALHEVWSTKHDAEEMREEEKELPKLMTHLQEAMETGELPKTDKVLTNLFYRRHQKGSDTHAKLKACRTWAEKRAFTKEWCAETYKEQEESKTHSKSFKKVDKSKGEYMCFAVLAESFGILYDKELAIRKATIHATKCCKMAGDWINYDNMSETMEFLKIKKLYSEIMVEKWSKFKREYGEQDVTKGEMRKREAGEQPVPKAKAKAKAQTAQALGKAQALAAGASQKRTADAAGLDGGSASSGVGFKHLCKKASLLKTRLTNVRSLTSEILGMIAGEKNGWGWAKGNGQTNGRLQKDLEKLNENVDDFAQVFLTEELKDLKAKYAVGHLHVRLEQFLSLETYVADLETASKKLQKMHKQSDS